MAHIMAHINAAKCLRVLATPCHNESVDIMAHIMIWHILMAHINGTY